MTEEPMIILTESDLSPLVTSVNRRSGGEGYVRTDLEIKQPASVSSM